jgi:hypothetical protein
MASPKLSAAQIKALSSHLGGKPMTRTMVMPKLKPAASKLTPTAPGMDAEDMIDGGSDEDKEKE